ncbi:MAG: hypothetical protein U5K54_22625 [Cytophagales bacterium]|nr:hypothetical protein [Cytophagales bacterium]
MFTLTPGFNEEDQHLFLKLDNNRRLCWALLSLEARMVAQIHTIGLDGSANSYIIGEAYDGDDGDLIIMTGFDSNGNKFFQDIADGFGEGKSDHS